MNLFDDKNITKNLHKHQYVIIQIKGKKWSTSCHDNPQFDFRFNTRDVIHLSTMDYKKKTPSEMWHVVRSAQPNMSTSEHWHCIQWPFFKTAYLFLSATQSNIGNMLWLGAVCMGCNVWKIQSETNIFIKTSVTKYCNPFVCQVFVKNLLNAMRS
jgi:hypothetical protein